VPGGEDIAPSIGIDDFTKIDLRIADLKLLYATGRLQPIDVDTAK
jgi:hypothetical protein